MIASAERARGSDGDPYRGVVVVLAVAALLGTLAAAVAAWLLASVALGDAVVTLCLSTGVLIGVASAQLRRATPSAIAPAASPPAAEPTPTSAPVSAPTASPPAVAPSEAAPATEPAPTPGEAPAPPPQEVKSSIASAEPWFSSPGSIASIRGTTAGVGAFTILLVVGRDVGVPTTSAASAATALCLAAAGLSAVAARYLARVDAEGLPEAPGLCRGARVAAWMFAFSAASTIAAWAGQSAILWALRLSVITVNAAICYGLVLPKKRTSADARAVFPLDFTVFAVLGSRPNLLLSVLDAAEQQLGIDLRSTWALAVVRMSIEPLLIGLCLLGWLSTSLTVIGLDEQGLVERLGVPVGAPLAPGLHLRLPWPLEHVYRIPVARVQSLTVGHEGQEEGGPENVLWARQHARNEYTLVLGNGRDLITVDATVQYRIKDARAFFYDSQNPAQALGAVAYRAVMRNTVDRTLADALSQNVVTLTAQMRGMVQEDADAMGLGVEVLAFTVGGMHPPVPVAPAYQAVVSAELGKVTLAVDAEAYKNKIVPAAEAEVVTSESGARAEAAGARAVAAGEAWSFRTLQSQYRVAPEEYLFRRRLEALESALPGRRFTVVDRRIERDGGELWLMP